MRLGPSLHLTRRGEMAGVWPLRIPDSAQGTEGCDPTTHHVNAAWPFLLIVRTGRIVTAHAVTLRQGVT